MWVDVKKAVEVGGKPWRYVLVPQDRVTDVYALVSDAQPDEDERTRLEREREAARREFGSTSREYRRANARLYQLRQIA